MAEVSVIIPCYNQGHFLPDAVRSVLGQSFNDIEIIIVDDCSTDNSAEVAAGLQKDAPDAITFLQNTENMGVSRTRNRGAEASSGAFLAFLDSDDYWHPEKISRQLKFLKAAPDTGFVHSKVRVVADQASKQWLTDNSNYLLKGVDQLEDAINSFCDRAAGFSRTDYFKTLHESNCICLASTLIRREAFQQAGGFGHGLTSQAEDWLLWLKSCMYAPPGVLPEPLAMYRFHTDNHTATVFAHPDYDFGDCRRQILEMTEAHDPESFQRCLKECGLL